MNRLSVFALFSIFFVVPVVGHASDKIQFPESELAVESVLPVFDQADSVKNRAVVTSRRLELGIMGGYALTEPFFNPLSYGGTATYHINEDHGINMFGLIFVGGPSSYSKDLNPIPGTTTNANLQYAPEPKYLYLLNYQFTGYYGKLSVTKQMIMHLGLYGLAGVGMIGIGDVSKPAASFGLGQKFYFNERLALRFDLRFLVYQGPDVLSRALDQRTSTQPASAFDEKMQFGTLLSFGAVYLLPAF